MTTVWEVAVRSVFCMCLLCLLLTFCMCASFPFGFENEI